MPLSRDAQAILEGIEAAQSRQGESDYTDDWWLFSVLADSLADAGDDERERAVRWLAAAKKRPYKSSIDWYVFCQGATAVDGEDQESNLPEEIYRRMENYLEDVSYQKNYRRFEDALLAMIDAIVAACKEGWTPHAP